MSATESLDVATLKEFHDQHGTSLADLANRGRLLLVFLRHLGCVFCRQALADLKARRQAIEAQGTAIALVHMQTDEEARKLFGAYHLGDVSRISDPRRALYRHFGLEEGGLAQVGGPAVWLPGLKSIFSGNFPGIPKANVWQLPGVFLLEGNRILAGHRQRHSADHVDFLPKQVSGGFVFEQGA